MVRNISRVFLNLFSCPPNSNMWAFWGFPVALTEVLTPLQQHFSQQTGEKQKPASEADTARRCLGGADAELRSREKTPEPGSRPSPLPSWLKSRFLQPSD